MKILYLYKWCTFGGVERVLLNRALAFKKYGIPVKIDVYFYYGGVINDFRKVIKKYNLDNIDVTEKLDFKEYNLVISIDTPEAFNEKGGKSLILEYHTHYEEHSSYLKEVSQKKLN